VSTICFHWCTIFISKTYITTVLHVHLNRLIKVCWKFLCTCVAASCWHSLLKFFFNVCVWVYVSWNKNSALVKM
jgi:hypothetical protein